MQTYHRKSLFCFTMVFCLLGGMEQLLAQRANLIAGIRANNPGLLEARLTRHEDGTYTDMWRWQSAEQMAAALAGSARFPLVGATLALTHDASVQNGEIVDER